MLVFIFCGYRKEVVSVSLSFFSFHIPPVRLFFKHVMNHH